MKAVRCWNGVDISEFGITGRTVHPGVRYMRWAWPAMQGSIPCPHIFKKTGRPRLLLFPIIIFFEAFP